ncbi:hypothetical protein PVPAM_130012800 [Plasmodium vivax]|nr:hypothetical protein PVPAM_130012800 [Plasmodium vivax]
MAAGFSLSDDYDFFHNIGTYIYYENYLENEGKLEQFQTACEKISTPSNYSYVFPSRVDCQKFLYLVKLLNDVYGSVFNKYHCSFLNYWINSKLKSYDLEKAIDPKSFYADVMVHYEKIKFNETLKSNLKSIDNEILDKLNILYNLHKSYSKIYNDTNSEFLCKSVVSCSPHTTACYNEYKKGMIRCLTDKTKFCELLNQFGEKYNDLKNKPTTSLGFNITDLIILPSQEEISKEFSTRIETWEDKTIMINSILVSTFGISFILLILYKFTQFGKCICLKKKDHQAKGHILKNKYQEYVNISEEKRMNLSNNPYLIAYNTL